MPKKVVIIADDSAIFRKLEGTYLSRQDYDVRYATDGRDALHQVNTARPDLVVLDLQMPEIEGDLLCRIIKRTEHLKHIPVILITSHADAKGEARCRNAGCDLFLSKPIDRARFLKAIRKLAPA